MRIIKNEWKYIVFVDFYDIACSSSRLASIQGPRHRRQIHKRMSKCAIVVPITTQCITKPISGPMAPPRSLSDPVPKKHNQKYH